MSVIAKRTQLIATSLEYERIEQGLREWQPDKVIIVTNIAPLPTHKEVAEVTLEKTKELVKKSTRLNFHHGSIEIAPVDFYHFNVALPSLYEVVYREKKLGNQLIVNLAGGTRPVAIASVFACALCGFGFPVYLVAETYDTNRTRTRVGARGVIDSTFPIEMTDTLFNLEKLIPQVNEELTIIRVLLDSVGYSSRLTAILQKTTNARKPTVDKPSSSEYTRYTRAIQKLEKQNFLKKSGRTLSLTEIGKVVGNIIRAKERIDNDFRDS